MGSELLDLILCRTPVRSAVLDSGIEVRDERNGGSFRASEKIYLNNTLDRFHTAVTTRASSARIFLDSDHNLLGSVVSNNRVSEVAQAKSPPDC